ncbi:MAG: hypothetical protein LBD87_06265 [Prevotellaceae bacterium]|jgi:hypothetical protein|nr:hypothetical protein [Prevotellaceae bacterium]
MEQNEQALPPSENGATQETEQATAATTQPNALNETPPAPAAAGDNAVLTFVATHMPELSEASEAEKYEAVADLLKKNHAFNEAMDELFKREPEIAALITAVMKGEGTFINALAKTISPDELSALIENDGEDSVKARDARHEKFKAYRKREANMATNAAKTNEHIARWMEKKGWDEAKQKDFFDKVLLLLDAAADGILTAKELDQLEQMIYFDEAITAAREEGIVAGRNEKIDDKRLQEAARKATDGLPALTGGGAPAGEKPAKTNPFDDVIDMKSKQNKF